MAAVSFAANLADRGLALGKGLVRTLQINTGYRCNLACRHCHLDAGPARSEVMSSRTMDAVIEAARRIPFDTLDVTGGAPELVPDIRRLLVGLAPLAPSRLFRTNLLALEGHDDLIPVLVHGGWTIVASLPALNERQVEAMRGAGVLAGSLRMLRRLNLAGYGAGADLPLHLVANPSGAFLPPPQGSAERQFKRELADRHGIRFASLYVFANVPLGRFKAWLDRSGNLDAYALALRGRFNPASVSSLMCRTLLSVAWDGRLYDCDFNQAASLTSRIPAATIHDLAGLSSRSDLDDLTHDADIPTGDHCFACTAGAGFT